MEAQMHRTEDRDYDDSLHPDGTHLHGEKRSEETRSAMKKVKEKVDKLKSTIKHGHGHHGGEHIDEAKAVNESPVVRSGLAEPTVMGTPVLAEDLYAPHSDILDPPVRSFAQWEDEVRHGEPPPLSTDYETHLTDYETRLIDHQPHVGHDSYRRDENKEELNTGDKEVGITGVLKSFDKMKVFDESHPKSSESDQNNQVYTGSHDQFKPEPVENPSHPDSSYTGKISSVTSAISNKAAAVKDSIVSKLSSSGENTTSTRSSFPTDFSHKVADTLSSTLGPVYETVAGAGSAVVSKMQGTGDDDTTGSPATKVVPEGKGFTVKEYLVDTFKPGDDDKVLSEVITHAFHRGKGNQSPEEASATAYVIRDEGERRLQDSSN